MDDNVISDGTGDGTDDDEAYYEDYDAGDDARGPAPINTGQ